MSGVAPPRGEGATPWNRGQDARDTQGRDALATGLRGGMRPAHDRKNGHAPKLKGSGTGDGPFCVENADFGLFAALERPATACFCVKCGAAA